MVKKLMLSLPTLALASAFAASSYHVKFFDESSVAGKTIKPGDYKLELTESGITLKHDKDVTAAPARVETAPKKFNNTTVRVNEKHEVQEIHLGGTNKKIVLTQEQSQPANRGL
jgi:hypothetical protein